MDVKRPSKLMWHAVPISPLHSRCHFAMALNIKKIFRISTHDLRATRCSINLISSVRVTKPLIKSSSQSLCVSEQNKLVQQLVGLTSALLENDALLEYAIEHSSFYVTQFTRQIPCWGLFKLVTSSDS
jgi:hypothetical protein